MANFLTRFIGCMCAALLSAAPAWAAESAESATTAKFVFNEKGIAIDGGPAGVLSMKLPRLTGVKIDGQVESKSADGKVMRVTYGSSTVADITIENDTTLNIRWSHLPAEAKATRLELYIPISFGGTGKYQFGTGSPQVFPQEKQEKPFMFQGTTDEFTLIHPTGLGFKISSPPYSFQQLQDNRHWNWATYQWWSEKKFAPDNIEGNFTYRLSQPGSSSGASAKVKPLIDRYGQHMARDFPDKITADDQLKGDVAADQAYYSSLTPPATDPYGGLPGSQAKYGLKKTGFFHLEKANGRDVLVTPDGNIFFQLGMCGVGPGDDYTTVRGREAIFEWIPSSNDAGFKTAWRDKTPGVFSFYVANLIRKYGEPYDARSFYDRWMTRLRHWGFNSGGAWFVTPGPSEQTIRDAKFPQIAFLPLGSTVATMLPVKGVWDPFTDGIEQKMDAAFAKTVAPQAEDPLMIGWFIVNEPLIEDVPKIIPTLKASKFAAKRKFVESLQERYGSIEQFNDAWENNATSFADLGDKTLEVKTKAAADDVQRFFGVFLERRYKLVHDTLRKYDRNHLLIGDRWMPGTANNQLLVSTAGKYLDVMSVNYYTYGIDKTFLQKIHDWSGGKPLLLSEFHYACRDQGLTGGVMQVATQQERGLAYRNYVEQAASTGFVVGIQWFIGHDQATTGRFFEGFNGEAAGIGLVNVADRPYKPFLAEVIKTNYEIYSVILGQRSAFVYDDPRFSMKRGGTKVVQAPRARTSIKLDGSREEWPALPPTRVGAEGLVLGQDASGFECAYWLCWDDTHLYIYADIQDPTPLANKQPDDHIWADDGIEVFTGFDNLTQGGSLQFSDRQVLIRGGKSGAPMAYVNTPRPFAPGEVAVVRHVDGKGYTLEAAIPLAALGFTPTAGQTILFDLAIDDATNGRRQITWNGTARNSKDRGSWGRVEFTR